MPNPSPLLSYPGTTPEDHPADCSSRSFFGVLLQDLTRADLVCPAKGEKLRALFYEAGGLLIIRNPDLVHLSPVEFVKFSEIFGPVEREIGASFSPYQVGDEPVLRIGNRVHSETGNDPVALTSRCERLPVNAPLAYDPASQFPVWHTDATHRVTKPIGSALHCKTTPKAPGQGDTLFADARQGLQDCVFAESWFRARSLLCSQAHHDEKIRRTRTKDYPRMSARQREETPFQLVPMVLEHPVTGIPAFYGWNSSCCKVVVSRSCEGNCGDVVGDCRGQTASEEGEAEPGSGLLADFGRLVDSGCSEEYNETGTSTTSSSSDGKITGRKQQKYSWESMIDPAELSQFEDEGVEHASVIEFRKEVLPDMTKHAVRWSWRPGDIAVWDNRCTMHAPTGMDYENERREMWRTTILPDGTNLSSIGILWITGK